MGACFLNNCTSIEPNEEDLYTLHRIINGPTHSIYMNIQCRMLKIKLGSIKSWEWALIEMRVVTTLCSIQLTAKAPLI